MFYQELAWLKGLLKSRFNLIILKSYKLWTILTRMIQKKNNSADLKRRGCFSCPELNRLKGYRKVGSTLQMKWEKWNNNSSSWVVKASRNCFEKFLFNMVNEVYSKLSCLRCNAMRREAFVMNIIRLFIFRFNDSNDVPPRICRNIALVVIID